MQLQEGLLKYDDKLNPVPALAEKFEVSPDGMTYTFHLRDAKWSDGVPVKSEDFITGWKHLLEPKSAWEYAFFLFDVVNAEAYNQGKITDFNKVGIRAINEKTLEVKLHHPASYFVHIPCYSVTYPQRKDILDAHPNDFTEPLNMRTTGPYRLTSWEHDSKLVLEPNPYYYGKKPSIAKVVFYVVKEDSTALSLYEQGSLDVTMRIPALAIDRVKSSPEYRSVPYLRGYMYGFNINVKPFDDVLVRKAFAHAVNRDEIVQVIKGGKIPLKSWVPKGMSGYEPEIGLDYNPELAKKLLAQAGFPEGKGFPKVTLMFDSLEMNKLIGEKLQYAWKTILGIPQIDIETREWKVYLETLRTSAPGVWRFGWGADFPDPYNFLDMFSSKNGNNHTRWKNATYDKLLQDAAVALKPESRNEIYRKAQKLLLEEDTVIIPLFQETHEALVKPYLKDFVLDPLGTPLISNASIVR